MTNLSRQFQDRIQALRTSPLLRPPKHKKVIGLALGERSLLAAEVLAGDRPAISNTAEFVYPDGIGINQPTELGALLAAFLAKEGFTANAAVIGLPARWVVTQIKDVPAADERTTAGMLRLSAEAEFSSELKDLVYDYTGSGQSVLLVATPRKYVDAANAICESARLKLLELSATSLALGDATGRGARKDVLVLTVAGSGSEMTLQRDSSAGVLRFLRPPEPQAPFINELRRAVSTMPPSRYARELILWDGVGLDASTLSGQIGSVVRTGEMALLGVSSLNGTGTRATTNGKPGATRIGQYAASVALALDGLEDRRAAIDFLHSRLAPPRQHHIPRWAYIAAAALLILVICTVYAFHELQDQSVAADAMQARYSAMKSHIDDADAFVSKVSFAQTWHGGDPRYLACMRDMTDAIKDDADTFALSLIIGDAPRAAKAPDTHELAGVLQGKAAAQRDMLRLVAQLKRYKGFTDVSPAGAESGRNGEVTFSIDFRYQLEPTKP
jgi:hypothetical protein